MTMAFEVLAMALVAVGGVLCAPDGPRIVSLEDVTGSTASPQPQPLLTAPKGFSEVGYGVPRPGGPGIVSLEDVTGISRDDQGVNVVRPVPHQPRPGQPSFVSLEDVTGIGHDDHGFRPVPHHPRPGQHGVVSLEDVTGIRHETPDVEYQYPRDPAYNPYRPPSPCYAPAAYTQPQPQGLGAIHRPSSVNVLSFSDVKPGPGHIRVRRSPSPSPRPGGVVPLKDVVGPSAAYSQYYPAYGPPAYVRPDYYNYYNNYNGYYPRPRPYYVVPCIGDATPDDWMAHRPVLPVRVQPQPPPPPPPSPPPRPEAEGQREPLSEPERRRPPPGPSEKVVEYYTDYVPREFIRRRREARR